jgi:NAD(P)-dependent dehydrogenase (short-subunit alcohol dehydrogenase family)
VNNAGIVLRKPFLETTGEDLEETLATNVKAVFCLSREAAKGMSRRGRGCIINASSISGSLGFENRSAYCASKGAVNLLTRAMAFELGPMGIRVNAVAPES